MNINEKGRKYFCWIINIEVTKRNLEELIETGIGRTKMKYSFIKSVEFMKLNIVIVETAIDKKN